MIENLLRWYVELGADEAIGDEPQVRFIPPASSSPAATPPPAAAPTGKTVVAPAPLITAPLASKPVRMEPALGVPAAVMEARRAAGEAATLAELEAAVARFEGCALRATATRMVFADGNPKAEIMILGEAPGAEEDRQGKPFVGASGKLLDRMLATIGLDRTGVYISNMLFWRPPGNRTPTAAEIELCRPFVERHITLVRPRIVILSGAVACNALFPSNQGITKVRGRWRDLHLPGLEAPLQAIAMYHPSFLLRAPERKREAWLDLLSIKSKFKELAK